MRWCVTGFTSGGGWGGTTSAAFGCSATCGAPTLHAVTSADTTGETVTTMSSESSAAGEFHSVGESAGMVMEPQFQMLGPNAENASVWPAPLSESIGTSSAHGSSTMSGTSRGEARGTMHAHTHAETTGHGRASSRSRARSRGASEMSGEHEGHENVFQDLPSAWHSIESERYRAGELLRALPIGRCFISFRGKTVCLRVPKAKRQS